MSRVTVSDLKASRSYTVHLDFGYDFTVVVICAKKAKNTMNVALAGGALLKSLSLITHMSPLGLIA